MDKRAVIAVGDGITSRGCIEATTRRIVGSTASSESSSQVQPSSAPWRIHCRDGRDMSMTTSISRLFKLAV